MFIKAIFDNARNLAFPSRNLKRQLFKSIHANDYKGLFEALRVGASPHEPIDSMRTHLKDAIDLSYDIRIVQALLDAGADPATP